MIRLGILDFDTSHCVEFTKRLNHQAIAEEQWVQGARVVIGYPGTSRIAPQLVPTYRKEMERLGISMAARPEDMIGKVDGMLIESQEGGVHYQRARPFLEAGIPCFVDKPLSCSVADAIRLIELAEKKNVPIFSSSSLRYAPDLVQLLSNKEYGEVLGAISFGPAMLHEYNPGLFHYGIHPVELLYTLMGSGCKHVCCTHNKDVDVVTGEWKGGRIGTVRGIRSGASAYGCVVFTEHKVQTITVDTRFIYRELLKKIVEMFTTRRSPLDVRVTVEIVAFMEAAIASANNHGIPQPMPSVLRRTT
jgi:hypothetical protein